LGGVALVGCLAVVRATMGFGIFVINVLRIYYKNTAPTYPAQVQQLYYYLTNICPLYKVAAAKYIKLYFLKKHHLKN
jgi:hypothetical protein